MALMLRSSALRHNEHFAVSRLPLTKLAPVAAAAGATIATSVGLEQVKSGKPKTVASFIALGAGGAAAWTGQGEILRAVGMGIAAGSLWSLFRKGGEGRSFIFPL